jgi:predicted DNA-binding transcriptional regulator AlpA
LLFRDSIFSGSRDLPARDIGTRPTRNSAASKGETRMKTRSIPPAPKQRAASLLGATEMAHLFRVSIYTVMDRARKGLLPPPQYFGNRPVWFRAEIDRWLKKRK